MKNTFSRGTKLLVILGRHGDPNCSMFCFVFSYVLTGTEKGMNQTFGTTCHGAVSSYIICNIFSWFESMMTKKMQNDHSISWFQTLGWIRFETCKQICLFVMIFSFPFSQKVFWNGYLYIYIYIIYLSIFLQGRALSKSKSRCVLVVLRIKSSAGPTWPSHKHSSIHAVLIVLSILFQPKYWLSRSSQWS